MATCEFKLDTEYKVANNDLLLFFFANEDTPIFSRAQVPLFLPQIDAPAKAGKALTVAAGWDQGQRFIARAIRLDDDSLSVEQMLKKSISSAISGAKDEDIKRIIIFLSEQALHYLLPCQEAALLGGYKFDKYLEKKNDLPLVSCVCECQPGTQIEEELKGDAELFSWVNFARDILNEPPNEVHPESLAKIFQTMGKDAGLKVSVWDEKKLEKEGCGGILAVGKGASSKPRLVIGEYKPKKPKAFLALVGKGVTVDTGGYCLKPAKSQIGMKYDMGGAAMTFAAACAIARLKLPIRVVVITPLVENDISSTSFHTQDIIKMRNGKTVQVDNTDAEGRLILADALCLAGEMKPDYIVDAATLTGACVVALGEDIAGVFGPDSKLNRLIIMCGKEADEHLWELPLFTPYMEQLKTEVADLKNIGSRWGGAITAALFLKNFVPEEIPWTHIDIAGPCVKEEPLGFLGKGAKGFGVKTLVEFTKHLLEEE